MKFKGYLAKTVLFIAVIWGSMTSQAQTKESIGEINLLLTKLKSMTYTPTTLMGYSDVFPGHFPVQSVTQSRLLTLPETIESIKLRNSLVLKTAQLICSTNSGRDLCEIYLLRQNYKFNEGHDIATAVAQSLSSQMRLTFTMEVQNLLGWTSANSIVIYLDYSKDGAEEFVKTTAHEMYQSIDPLKTVVRTESFLRKTENSGILCELISLNMIPQIRFASSTIRSAKIASRIWNEIQVKSPVTTSSRILELSCAARFSEVAKNLSDVLSSKKLAAQSIYKNSLGQFSRLCPSRVQAVLPALESFGDAGLDSNYVKSILERSPELCEILETPSLNKNLMDFEIFKSEEDKREDYFGGPKGRIDGI